MTLKIAGKLAILIVSAAYSIAAYADGLFLLLDESGRLPLDSMQDSLDVELVDSDGDLDLVVGNSRKARDRLYLNNGTGVFTDSTLGNLPEDEATNTDIDIIDLNSDGALDVVVTNVGNLEFDHGFLGEPKELRAGGNQPPPDRVVGGAANKIDGYSQFALEVLYGYSL